MDRWDDLRLFLAVARAGTLTGAAAELAVSVSTLHRRLAAFEEAVGSSLFTKDPRGYQLTQAGEALLPHAEEVEEAVFSATRAVVGHDQQASGEVRITLPLMMLTMLTPHLTEFSKVCGGIRPILQPNDLLLDLHRETDIAFRATTQPLSTAIGRHLCDLAWGHYAPAETEGTELPWVHYVGMDHARAVQWRRKMFPNARPRMMVHGVMGMYAVLAPSGAQGVLPCFIGDADPTLRRVGAPVAADQLWLLVHADLHRSARVRALINFLVPRLLTEKRRFEGRVNAPE
ncbi:MAG: LysR family transcriptional regulator [Bradymonadia bacterium]